MERAEWEEQDANSPHVRREQYGHKGTRLLLLSTHPPRCQENTGSVAARSPQVSGYTLIERSMICLQPSWHRTIRQRGKIVICTARINHLNQITGLLYSIHHGAYSTERRTHSHLRRKLTPSHISAIWSWSHKYVIFQIVFKVIFIGSSHPDLWPGRKRGAEVAVSAKGKRRRRFFSRCFSLDSTQQPRNWVRTR